MLPVIQIICIAASATSAFGQARTPPTGRAEPATVGNLAFAGFMNVAVAAGLAAGKALLSDEQPVFRTAAKAAAGAGVHFAGKSLAGIGGSWTGITGRLVAATGSSMIRNAVVGVPALSCLSLPVGPLWLNSRGCDQARVSVDAVTVIGIILASQEGRFAARESITSGALVFRLNDAADARVPGAWALGGVLTFRATPLQPEFEAHQIRHERIHVIQHDLALLAVSRPSEDWLRQKLAIPRPRLLDLDVGLYAAGGFLLHFTPFDVQPIFEWEARVLDGS